VHLSEKKKRVINRHVCEVKS